MNSVLISRKIKFSRQRLKDNKDRVNKVKQDSQHKTTKHEMIRCCLDGSTCQHVDLEQETTQIVT